MNVTVRIRSRQLRDALRAYIDRRVYSSLGRFAERLHGVSVGIADIDLGTGTPYYSCRVEAELMPSGGPLVEEVSDGDLFRAIDRAMDQVGRALWEGVRPSPHRDGSLTRLRRVAAVAGQGG
jgi:ribosome-associated translation inhibitor RaiA